MRQLMTFRAAILSCSALALVPSAIGEEGDKPWSQADAIWGEEAMAEARAQVLQINHLKENHYQIYLYLVKFSMKL